MNNHHNSRNRSHPITNAPFKVIFVHSLTGNPQRGRVSVGNLRFTCALGKGGTKRTKREGDGATPVGTYRLRSLWYRSDRIERPQTSLLIRATKQSDGWCDSSNHRRYNRPVSLPFNFSHELMWREDHLYDVVVEIGWNDRPAKPGRGSAIFMHLARPRYLPTEGCIALSKADMNKLLPRIGPKTRIIIQ
jgi:L,D-peptidoglycan transpeptidase YkuD (ErfK/YbiS/YcfS/YnhG family)